MRVIKTATAKTCAVCERSLLMGEHTSRFSPDGREYVDVCVLCHDAALGHGWTREGLPLVPGLDIGVRRRKPRPLWQALLGGRDQQPAPVVTEPALRRLSNAALQLAEAADLFNQSQFRRTITSVSRSLGPPNVSVAALSGVSGETVLTFAWDITWYQYRVSPESAQPVRVAERGTDPAEIEAMFTDWNAALDDDGRVVPDVARL
jgi:hypothetical protein